MLISKKWLQSYFTNELPSMQKIADTLLLHSFEIEGLEEKNGDWVLDVDILPNRAHDCLCHEGIAKELSGLLSYQLQRDRFSDFSSLQTLGEKLLVKVENTKQCKRYMAVLVKNIEQKESPEWLKNRLNSMGQKSINALVDATNFIMFDIGQPMHVFDADKVSGGIVVRNAKEGEKMLTLSGEEIDLLPSDLLICDEEKILALAGVKGGIAAEVDEHTKHIIIESANFDALSTRKTARRVKILTDASKRYENTISSEKAEKAIHGMLSLVMEVASGTNTEIGDIMDVYPSPETPFQLTFTQEHTARLLGFPISIASINTILDNFYYIYEEKDGNYRVQIPSDRLDLRISEDMIEEIGRLYGYHNIPIASVGDLDFQGEVNKSFYISQSLRNYFVEKGFTEIMNYTFVNKGEVELYNPLASDKKALRKNLIKQMKISMEKNARIADFVNAEQTLLFEIDKVHTKDGEKIVCAFAIDTLSKKARKKYGDAQKQILSHIEEIEKMFQVKSLVYQRDGDIIQFSLEDLEENISPETYDDLLKKKTYGDDAAYKGISIYPYVKRDISFWITKKEAEEIQKSLEALSTNFLQKVYLFDEFKKEDRTSYAFSLIFQSFEKTLTDEEVVEDMKIIEEYIISIDGEIR